MQIDEQKNGNTELYVRQERRHLPRGGGKGKTPVTMANPTKVDEGKNFLRLSWKEKTKTIEK